VYAGCQELHPGLVQGHDQVDLLAHVTSDSTFFDGGAHLGWRSPPRKMPGYQTEMTAQARPGFFRARVEPLFGPSRLRDGSRGWALLTQASAAVGADRTCFLSADPWMAPTTAGPGHSFGGENHSDGWYRLVLFRCLAGR